MPGYRRKSGRPAAMKQPSDFGTELTFEELGRCLGMSRYKAKVLVVDNGLPTISRGKVQTIHRAIAEQIVSGDWWLNQARA